MPRGYGTRHLGHDTRTGLINDLPRGLFGPQGLKPAFLLALNGTAEAVPCPKPFMGPVLKTFMRPVLRLCAINRDAANHGPQNLCVFQFLRWHREKVAVDQHKIRLHARRERSEFVLLV